MLFPSSGGVGREGEQCADHKAQEFLRASLKYLEFFKNLLRISLPYCLPTQMLSCVRIYHHPPVPSVLEVQHCARMPEEAAGSIALIPQLPRPPLSHHAEDTDPLLCHPTQQQACAVLSKLNAERKVGESPPLIVTHHKPRITEAKGLTVLPPHTLWHASF